MVFTRRPRLVVCSALLSACGCSSDITLAPLRADAGSEYRPLEPGRGGGGGTESQSGAGGTATAMGGAGGGEPEPPVVLEQGGAGGDSVTPSCSDMDGDLICDLDDGCPTVANAGNTADTDRDATPDACDLCPNVAAQDDAKDVDQDGTPDACDVCGIGVALGFGPMFYFPLDEGALAGQAANLGSVAQNGTYFGPVQRGLAGVADPAGRAVRLAGQQAGQFSRISVLNVSAFPSTALTATFWVRTAQAGDYSVISYALTGSENEFGIIVQGNTIRLTINNSSFAADLSASRLTDGAWHFVALSWQQASAQVYFDAVPAGAAIATTAGNEITTPGSVPVTGPLSMRPGGALVLGQDQDGVNSGFSATQALQGGLDEVALYGRALSAAEVRSIFEGTTCGERCDGADNDADGKVDEGFLGSAPACAAASCAAIGESNSSLGSGNYFLSSAPTTPVACVF
jgi:hypothetical protein